MAAIYTRALQPHQMATFSKWCHLNPIVLRSTHAACGQGAKVQLDGSIRRACSHATPKVAARLTTPSARILIRMASRDARSQFNGLDETRDSRPFSRLCSSIRTCSKGQRKPVFLPLPLSVSAALEQAGSIVPRGKGPNLLLMMMLMTVVMISFGSKQSWHTRWPLPWPAIPAHQTSKVPINRYVRPR